MIDSHAIISKRLSRGNLFEILIGCLLLLCTFSGSITAGVVSVVLMIAFLIYLLIFGIVLYFRFLHFFFGLAAAITGCVFIEFTTINLYEINDFSHYVGALPVLVFSYWVFIMTIKLTNGWFEKRKDERKTTSTYQILNPIEDRRIMIVASLVGLFVVCFLFIKVFGNPSFVLGFDRFKYAQIFDYGRMYDYATKLLKYVIAPCIAVAVYYKSKIGWAALVIYCLYAFWVGNKFGMFFSLICFITMIYSEKMTDDMRQNDNKKTIAITVIAVAGSICLALFAVSFTTHMGLLDYLSSRTAQQGQLWWKTFELTNGWHANEFKDEIAAITEGARAISDNVGSNHGIYKIMYYTSPKSIIDYKLASGSRYAEAGFAASYYYFGILGTTVFAIISGCMVSISVNLFLKYLKLNQFIRAFLCLRLYFMTADMMSNFLFAGFFSIVSIVTYIVLIIGRKYVLDYSFIIKSRNKVERRYGKNPLRKATDH